MKQFLVDDWLDALTSGEYAQGREYLCRVTEAGERLYCCLGVATDLYQKAGGGLGEQLTLNDPHTKDSIVRYNDEGMVLPEEVAKWMDTDTDPQLTIRNYNRTVWPGEYLLNKALTELNDEGFTFAQIADLIRYCGLESPGEDED